MCTAPTSPARAAGNISSSAVMRGASSASFNEARAILCGVWRRPDCRTASIAVHCATRHASRRHRHRHQLGPHDRRPGAPGLLLRGHRPGEGDGQARRRRPRRPQDDARSDDRGAAGAVEVRAAGPLAPGGRDPRRRHQRHPRGRERRRAAGRDRTPDRHPPAHHHRHRGSAADPPGRGLRRRDAKAGGGHRHRRRQRRGHPRRRRSGALRPQLQARRHPPDRALRHLRPAQPARRAQDAGAHRRPGRSLPGADRQRRVRPGHRHVGHDPLARRGGGGAGDRRGPRRGPKPAGLGQGDSPGAQAGLRSGARAAARGSRARCPARRPGGGRRACSSMRCSAGSTPRTSRCAIWRCARVWSSTSSTATASTSSRWKRSPTSAVVRRWSWASAAGGKPTTHGRWRGWRWASSTACAACTGSATASANGSSTRRGCTTSATTSATSATIGIPTT